MKKLKNKDRYKVESTMKAYNLRGVSDLQFENVDIPVPEDSETLVQIKAAGICGSDIPRIFVNGTYHFPTIPGHEFSGIDVKTKKRVGVFPLIPCRKCKPCRDGRYEMCRNYSYLGSRTDGGFAEYAAVPEWNMIELPDNVTFEQAAMLEPMAVAVHAMRSISPSCDDTVAVMGLGTIGMLLVMFLLDAGVTDIYVIGNKDFQRKTCKAMGIDEIRYIDAASEEQNSAVAEQIMNVTHGRGVGVFFECVGKNETIETALKVTAPGGRIQLVGNPASDISFDRDTYWKILRNQLTVKGSWNSSFTHDDDDDWHYVLKRLEAGAIHPEQFISHRFAFEELDKGLAIMRDKTEDYIKVMIE